MPHTASLTARLNSLAIGPTTTFDVSAYPHIRDGVFAHSTQETLLAARATCSTWRDRIDDLTLAHVTIFEAHIFHPPPSAYVRRQGPHYEAHHVVASSIGVPFTSDILTSPLASCITTLDVRRCTSLPALALPNLQVLIVNEYCPIIPAPRVVQVSELFATPLNATKNIYTSLNPALQGEVTWLLKYAAAEDLLIARLRHPILQGVTALTLVPVRIPLQTVRPAEWVCNECNRALRRWFPNSPLALAHFHQVTFLHPFRHTPAFLESMALQVHRLTGTTFKFVGKWERSWVIQHRDDAAFEDKFRWAVCNRIPGAAYFGENFNTDLTVHDVPNVEFVEADEGVDDVLARMAEYQ